MTLKYKILGQSNPLANTQTTLYTVPALTQAIVSTVTICNQSSTATTFNLAIQPLGAALVAKHYLNFNTAVPANDTITVTIGMTLGAADIISVSAGSASISFNAFGSEVS